MTKTLTFKKGTVIKIDGLPFKLINDTEVLGSEGNLRLIRKEKWTKD